MLALLSSTLSYSSAPACRSAVRARSASPLMVKSESLPFMEEPEHLSGMVGNVGLGELLTACCVRRSPGLGSSAAPLGSHSAALGNSAALGSTRQHSAALGNSATRQLGSLDSL